MMDCRSCPMYEFVIKLNKLGITDKDIIALEFLSKYLDIRTEEIKRKKDGLLKNNIGSPIG